MQQKLIILLMAIFTTLLVNAENGYELWLRYRPIDNQKIADNYTKAYNNVTILGSGATIDVINTELNNALSSMLQKQISINNQTSKPDGLLIATAGNLKSFKNIVDTNLYKNLGPEGFFIKNTIYNGAQVTIVSANTQIGLLYGTFNLLNKIQQQININNIDEVSAPKIKLRILNHWDNLDRTVERGYAGFSIWDWHKLPQYIDYRYIDYARANASIGINGTVLTNVNANALVLTTQYLEKVKALADVFRPYGIKVYLTARFSAPIEIGGLPDANPKNLNVQAWWKNKANDIYKLIPDFGGFLVKANSEGQPGPQKYGCNHADGANLLADAVGPHGGAVIWRAFVYETDGNVDRHMQASNEFVPIDGTFRDNVLIQVKNGAIDFQPREPFHPMFGAMPKTPLMMEFQITQEYTGCGTHLFYQAPLYKETLSTDTYAKGKGSTVAKVIDGSLDNHKISGISGVANIGNDINWTCHPFAQGNWYAYGRLAWDYELTAEKIANEWVKMTFNNNPNFVQTTVKMMIESRENLVNYMTPIGLHHIMAWNHHYGPGPWVNIGRADWTSLYYHRADETGIGFDRTLNGSKAVSQYSKPVFNMFNNPDSCPIEYLLWFHHMPWDKKLSTGRTTWDEICYRYIEGSKAAKQMEQTWQNLKPYVDNTRYKQVAMLLNIQSNEAEWWRDACMLYFQQFSKKPFPANYTLPAKTLDEYMKIQHRFVPGIKNE